jgi:hypothetical protein
MSINHTFKAHSLRAVPSHNGQQNVVVMVGWSIRFTKGDFESFAGGESVLDASNLAEFTPLEQITLSQLEQWVIASHGGEQFMNELRYHHELTMDRMAALEASQEVTLSILEPAAAPSVQGGPHDMTIEPVNV